MFDMANLIVLFQSLSEALLRLATVVLDLAIRLPRGLYSGLRWGMDLVGASNSVASVISGYVVTGLLLALLWLIANTIRQFRIKNRGQTAIFVGNLSFWIGAAIGIYFLGLIFHTLPRQTLSDRELYLLAGTAVLYPALGCLIQYVLGR